MALALYLLPLLLQVAASRVHHRNAQEVQDKLAGVDLADILIPILSKQELESKANNQSDKRVHALKKLIERSHVAIILAQPHDKEENHSIDSKHARNEAVGKHRNLKQANYGVNKIHKHVVHQKSDGIENNKHSKYANSDEIKQVNHLSPNDKKLRYASKQDMQEEEKNLSLKELESQKNLLKIANSEETSKDEDSKMSPGGKKEKINNMLKSSLHYNEENSDEDNDLRKDEYEDHEEKVEQHSQDMLDLKNEISESNKQSVENFLNKSGINSKTTKIQEDMNAKIETKNKNKHLLRNHDSQQKEQKEKHTVRMNNSKDNQSSDDRSESNEDSVVENNLLQSGPYSRNKDSYEEKLNEKEEHKEDNKVSLKNSKDQKSRDGKSESDEYNVEEYNLLRSGLNSKNKDSREDHTNKKFERNDDNEHLLNNLISRKEENKDIVSIEYLKDGSSESDDEDNKYLHRSGLQRKHEESQENDYEVERKQKYENKNSNVLRTVKHDNNVLKDLKDLLDSRDESSECDDEDSDDDGNSLMKMIDLAKMNKDMHFYDRRDNEDNHKRGVLNLFFHFA